MVHLDLRGDSAAALCADLREYEAVRSVESLSQHDQGVSVIAEVETDAVVAAAQESLTPLRFPLEIREGTVALEVVASHRRLATLGDRLDEAGLSWTVDRVRQSVESDPVLSSRQRQLLLTALEHGYYDTPRDCTLTELADELGIAKSTCSKRLHRAESAVVERLLQKQPTGPASVADDSTARLPLAQR